MVSYIDISASMARRLTNWIELGTDIIFIVKGRVALSWERRVATRYVSMMTISDERYVKIFIGM